MNSQELRALQEAYSQVYELDEAGKNDARIRGNIKSFGSNYTPPKDWDQSANRGQGAVLNAKQKEKQRRKGLAKGAMGEAVDLYDIILSHLLDEGYADTEQAAEAIMVNMSEDWRESIVEEVLDEGEKPFPYEKVTSQQKKHSAAGNYGNTMKMGLAKRRAKEADKKGGSQQDAGKGWYHGK
jgi:hypothetical protein